MTEVPVGSGELSGVARDARVDRCCLLEMINEGKRRRWAWRCSPGLKIGLTHYRTHRARKKWRGARGAFGSSIFDFSFFFSNEDIRWDQRSKNLGRAPTPAIQRGAACTISNTGYLLRNNHRYRRKSHRKPNFLRNAWRTPVIGRMKRPFRSRWDPTRRR